MDVIGASTAKHTQVDQWTWNGGANQKWSFQDAGGGYLHIVNQNSGKCLDVAGASTADAANIIQYTCGTGTNQQWQDADRRQLRPTRRPPQRASVSTWPSAATVTVQTSRVHLQRRYNQQWSRTVS